MNTSAKREGRIGLTLGKILTNSIFAGCEKGEKKGREISVSINSIDRTLFEWKLSTFLGRWDRQYSHLGTQLISKTGMR